MTHAAPTPPQYAHRFRCIGSDCEDTCCQGWQVPVDEATYRRYQNLPPGPLQSLIVDNLDPKPAAEAAKNPAVFAIIRMTPEHRCPMLSEDRLCRIQNAYGAGLLSHTCASYPRIGHASHGHAITALTLSCPEAARLVLLSPDLLSPDLLSPDVLQSSHATHPEPQPASSETRTSAALAQWIAPIRAAVLATATNRHYPLWQRLFLLSVFSRRLDAILAGELDRSPGHFLADFNTTVAQGSLRVAMNALPADDLAQMDAVLRLAGLMLHRSGVGPRFVDCVNAFTSGIGNGPGVTLAGLAQHTRTAWERFLAPFFAHHPYILENYLVNTILRVNFPFGSARNAEDAERTITQRFSILAAQFALIRGLLIGVAGHHRERFSSGHIVHTVQTASKHFEHHPEFQKQILALLAELSLDNSTGLTILLREPAPPAGAQSAVPLKPRMAAATRARAPQTV